MSPARLTVMPAVIALCLLAGACTPMRQFPYMKIVDQRTFGATAVAPSAPDVRSLPERPLAVIRFDGQSADYTPDLSDLVAAATARKPDVEFNVITPVAIGATPSARSQGDAATVAHSLAEQEILPERIHLGVVEEAGKPAREVRIFVR